MDGGKKRKFSGIPFGSIKPLQGCIFFYLDTRTYKYKKSIFILTKPPPKNKKKWRHSHETETLPLKTVSVLSCWRRSLAVFTSWSRWLETSRGQCYLVESDCTAVRLSHWESSCTVSIETSDVSEGKLSLSSLIKCKQDKLTFRRCSCYSLIKAVEKVLTWRYKKPV